MDYDFLVKIVICGETGVGKTALLRGYMGKDFNQDSHPTIGYETRIVQTNNQKIKLQIWDTETRTISSFARVYFRGALGAIIVFDDRRSTFEKIPQRIQDVKDNSPEAKILILGNKVDQRGIDSVTSEEARIFAEGMGCLYAEASAKTGEGVSEAFEYLLTGKEPASLKGKLGSANLPLMEVKMNAKIVDLVAEVVMKQTFENFGSQTVEIAFEFPKPTEANIFLFECLNVNTGEIIEGKLKERGNAFNQYSDVIASGKSAFLLEDEASSLKMSLGMMIPQDRIELTIGYTFELQSEWGNPLFSLPVTRSGLTLSKQISTQFAVDIEMGNIIEEIEFRSSPTNPILFETERVSSKHWIVRYINKNAFHQDIEMLVKLEDALPNRAKIGIDAELGVAAIVDICLDDFVLPGSNSAETKEAATQPKPQQEFIFVVDRSGSMSGAPWKDASQAVQVFLRSLPPNCLFQVIGFGSNYEHVFPSLREYSEDNLKEASSTTAKWNANLGGTELFKPLKFAYTMDTNSSWFFSTKNPNLRSIFVITDGQVENKEEVITLTKKFSTDKFKTYALGIGSGVDRDLVQRLAAEGKGSCEFTSATESIQTKVIRLLKRSMGKEAKNVKINWDKKLSINTSSVSENSSLVLGENVRYAAIFNSLPQDLTDLKFSLSGELNMQPFELEIPFEIVRNSTIIHRRAAKQLISEQPPAKTIISLSLRYGLSSVLTAFIAVPKNQTEEIALEDSVKLQQLHFGQINTELKLSSDNGLLFDVLSRDNYNMQKSQVIRLDSNYSPSVSSGACCGGPSISVPSPWSHSGTFTQGTTSSKPLSSNQAAPASEDKKITTKMEENTKITYETKEPQTKESSRSETTTTMTLVPSQTSLAPVVPPLSNLDTLVLLQHADGSWDLNQALCTVLCKSSLKSLEQANPNEELPLIWGTALALASLELYFKEKQAVWDLIFQKGREYLSTCTPTTTMSIKQWLDLAVKSLKTIC